MTEAEREGVETRSGAARARGGATERAWRLAAVALLGCALVSAFHPYWGHDLRREAPAVPHASDHPTDHPGGWIAGLDHRFVVWLTARNAWTLLHRPTAFFDAEPCFPERNALTLGEPGIALGVVGIPGWLLSGDPVATFDLALPTFAIVWAAALFLLVRDWTGSTPAGVVAALLFSFHPVRRDEILHPYAWDNGWAALALFFAVRLCERGRWRDALGLAACGALQLGSSLYATLGAACLALPLGLWLVALHGRKRPKPLPWLAAALLGGAAAAAIFGPYLERRAQGVLAPRTAQYLLGWDALLPGGSYWPGPLLVALAALGLLLPGSRFARGLRDPRWALALGALLALLLATGGAPFFPNLIRDLARVVPGLDVIRGVSRLYSAVLLVLCVLAGLGAAALVRAAPERLRTAVAVALVLAAYVDTLRPASLGLAPRVEYRMTEIAPPRAAIELYERLAARGDAGPLAEVPLHRKTHLRNNTALLLSAYHHRRTSACRNSYLPPDLARVEATLATLPAPGAIARLRELGFRTIVIHHAPGSPVGEALRRRFVELGATPGGGVHPLDANASYSAWAIAR
jgi:hypothetical protein